ncbi:MAG: PIG-L family deacetylase [Pacificimonas sp.]
MTTTVLAVSPHLDDAIFSLGGYLSRRAAAGDRVIVATVFTGNVAQPQGFALACQLDKGLPPDVDYMALRREEDRQACTLIGAEPVHLNFLEAPHRGYDSAVALFERPRQENKLESMIADSLGELVQRHKPGKIYGPKAIGGHVDHFLVAHILAEHFAVRCWADYPYTNRADWNSDAYAPIELSGDEAALKLAAADAYATQVAFQFPDGLKVSDFAIEYLERASNDVDG